MKIVSKCSYRYIAALTALLMAASPLAAHAQAVDINVVVVDVVAVGKGYRVSQLIGRDVINEQSEEIGEVDDFIVGKDKVLFVILEVGGFLGLGAHLVAMPATAIDMEAVKGKIRIKSASRAQLKKMPEFSYGKDQGKSQNQSKGDQT
jgi:hypothetical protein